MSDTRVWVAGAVVALLAATGGGYLLGRDHRDGQAANASAPLAARVAKPAYYQDPDGKAIYSPVPKSTADGRAFKPVYAEGPSSSSNKAASGNQQAGRGKILYYRNPMGLPDTSRVPKKDPMGMDYIAVHEGEEETGVVRVSPARLQMLGVTTAIVTNRPALARTVRATGVVQADESKLAAVTTKFDAVVEKLFVSTTGATVRAGQPLARVWIQTPDTTMQIGPDIVTRQIDYVIALQDRNPTAIAQSEHVLREYGMPPSAIAEIRRTGRATRSITVVAPRSGVVVEKPAIEGMHFNTGAPLFKIADLSTVWLLADVQEQDLGSIRAGQSAQVSLVAFPGQTFTGKIDFIYPALTAATRTGHVRILLPNAGGDFRESMYATVLIKVPSIVGGNALVVPDSAVIDSGTRQVVLMVKQPGQFEPRAVTIGARGDGYAEVLSGLKLGQSVVTSANFLIDAESNLRASLQAFAGNNSAESETSK